MHGSVKRKLSIPRKDVYHHQRLLGALHFPLVQHGLKQKAAFFVLGYLSERRMCCFLLLRLGCTRTAYSFSKR